MATVHDHESRIAQLEAELAKVTAQSQVFEAALDQLIGQFDSGCFRDSYEPGRPYISLDYGSMEVSGGFCDHSPELTRYLSERFDIQNPLETEAVRA